MIEDGLRLDIGAGDKPHEGFTPVDRQNGDEAYPLKHEDGSVAEIRASHILEHFSTEQVPLVLADWVRALKPGGRIRIAVPDFEYIAKAYQPNHPGRGLLFAYTMGGQTDKNDFHRSLFDEGLLTALMENVGLKHIQSWTSDNGDCARLPVSLNLEGHKPEPRKPIDAPKIIGVMSTQRLGFTENLFCAAQVLQARGIDIIKNTGAFWGQCMERTMGDAIDQGAEWICTLDYDTAFTHEAFNELCWLFGTHTEIDALAPWQVKRECDDSLVWMVDSDGKTRREIPLEEFSQPVTQVDTAHFGLTMFRVSALKKMGHPWFMPKPAPDGTWSDDRVDEDIAFWHQWKKIGNTLYMANEVSIGHLQLVATWPDKYLRPIHQYVVDFQKHGKPRGAR